MKKKIVLWGHDENDKKILLALALQEKENKVHIHTFSEDKVSEEFFNNMMDKWRSGAEVEFPEGYETIIRELSVTDDILPETIKVQRADVINRAKTEWHFVVLSTKLYDLYSTELEDLKGKISNLMDFDNEIWDEMKGFWGKIMDQTRERNLFREHSDKLKDGTNELFGTMKELKTKANEKLAGISKEQVTTFSARLTEVKEKAEKGMSLGPLFDELKKIQNEFKNADFTRNDRSKVWKRIDEAFKLVKEKKYGKQPEGQQAGGAVSRLERRNQGLKSAIGKMKASIKRDQNDIDFHNSRNNKPSGQLEMQLREAKIKMIEGRMGSKQEKLNEMLATQTELEKKMEKEKAREVKKEEKKAIEKKKAELKKQVDAAVSDQAELSPEEAKKLELAASTLNKKGEANPKKAAEKTTAAAGATADEAVPQEGLLASAATLVSEAVEDVVDSVKAVGEVVSQKVSKKAEEMGLTGDDKADAKSADKKPATKTEKADPVVAQAEATAEKAKATIKESKATNEKVEETLKEVKGKATAKTEEKESSVIENVGKGGLLAGAIALGAKLMDKVEDVADSIVEKAGLDETVDKAKATLAKTEEAVKDKASSVADKAADAKEKVADKATEAKEVVSDKASETKEKVSDKVADTKEAVADKVKDAKAAAEPEVKENKAGETLAKGGLLGAAVALGSKMVGSISDKAEELADKAGMGDAFDSAKEKMGDLKDKASETIDSAKDSVSDMKDKAADKIEDVKADKDAAANSENGSTKETLAKGGLLGAAVALGAKLTGSVTESVESVADRVRKEGKDILPDSMKGKGEEE